jgi:hypothetical protein
MSPSLSLLHDEKKFMWDGCLYATRQEATDAGKVYQNDNFEVQVAEEEGKFLVYSRRAVKEVVVTAQ